MKKEIGLKKGTVKLKKYNSNWKKLFEQEKKLLLKYFRNEILEISHGGSTAIPDMPSKPIIDMFAVVKSIKVAEKIKKELESLDYHYRGKEGVPDRILYVKGDENNRTHHLQLMQRKSSSWKDHLLIKNYYLKNPSVAKEYAKLKKKLAKQHPNDRVAYRNGKDSFIKNVIAQAKLEKI